MSGSMYNAMNRALGAVFTERQVYIRSSSRTRYLTFTPVSQAALCLSLAAMLGWSGITSYSFIDRAIDGRTAENRLEASREAYEIQLGALREQQGLLEEELNRSNARGDAVTVELSAKQRLLVETATALQTAEVELGGLRIEVETLAASRREAETQIGALNEQIVALQLSLTEAERNHRIATTTFDAFAATMSSVVDERDNAAIKAEVLDHRVASLEQEIGHWETRQEHLLAQLEAATRTSLASLDKLFVGSDIDLDSILRQTKRDYTGQGGGPLDDDDTDAAAPAEEDGVRVAALMTDLERMSLMRVAIDRLPFGLPTKGAERTSGFGMRRDPMRRKSKMHNGVDFAAPRGTAIYSTGEGVVTFSGRQRGYGIVVKIRHAFGFETVYAHLSKSRVTVGQRVERGERIADMGSTGRSTGSHLHYEVRIDGVPINPAKFIRAARDVL